MGLFSKLSDSLSKTRKGFVEKLFDSFTGKEIDDDLFSTFCGWCYDVFLDEKTDYIVEMDQMIEDKKFAGVQLGVTAYMIARQYEINNDLENALSYYYTCIPCFHPENMYAYRAKQKTNEIAEALDKEMRV